MMYHVRRSLALIGAIFLFTAFVQGPALAADDFFLYGNQTGAEISDADLPEIGGTGIYGSTSWFTAVDYFRSGPNQGKMLAATGKSIYMQDAVGSSSWTLVAQVEDYMDPGFLKISPNGTQVALGLGYYQDLLVFDADTLDDGTPADPVELNNPEDPNADVTIFAGVLHYDAVWLGETHLVINGGDWIDEGQTAQSGVVTLDITSATNQTQGVCGDIPGASSGIALDASNNLVFGNGYTYDDTASATGELKIWKYADWWNGSGPTQVSYTGTEGIKIASQVLSAGHLGFDGEGNLHVGGGQYLGGANGENGFAVLINHNVVTDALDSTVAWYEVDETNGEQYREIAADSCQNDSATGVLAMGDTLSVVWNPTNAACNANSGEDEWGAGVTPRMTSYTINDTEDGDGDGVYDVDDFSPATADATNTDTDGDGYGDIIDADFNNDGIVDMSDLTTMTAAYGTNTALVDMNSDGMVDMADLTLIQQQYGNQPPYYNLQ